MAEINKFVFKAYDIRGIYPTDLNDDIAYKAALAYANFLPKADPIVICADYRNSSPAIKEAVIKGLMDGGKNIIDIGQGPTPLLYFGIAHYNHGGGIQITASHNPKEYNGLKLQKEKALPIYGENGIFEIRDKVLNNQLEKIETETTIEKKDILQDYIEHLVSKTKLKRPLKIIIDSGNGACGTIPEKIFKKLGCDVTTIFGEPDGNFPNHIADPYKEETLTELKKKVLEEKADLGIAYDGDGDRVGIIDEKGRFVSGEHQLIMLSREVLKEFKGTVVYEVRSSKVMLNDIKEHGGEPIMAVAGHAYVLDSVFKNNAVFGGELTGHIYFPKHYYYFDDGIFVSLKLAEIVSNLDSLADYVDTLPVAHASPEYFVDCPDEKKEERMNNLKDYLKENKYDVLDIDGVRINLKNGWALARPSNTAPLIKCRFEGDTEVDLKKIQKEIGEIFKKFDIVIKELE